MINRNTKVRFAQISLLIISLLIIFFTYFHDKSSKNTIVSPLDKKRLKVLSENSENSDVFFNIKYSGLDLSGNRYILTSKEAFVDKNLQEIVNMNIVDAIFYFKDNTVLNITSEKGIYNNKSLDMVFEKNVIAKYEGSELSGDKVIYLNSKKTLEVSDNVKLKDPRGTMVAEKLLFNLETKKVDISSSKNKISTNINLK